MKGTYRCTTTYFKGRQLFLKEIMQVVQCIALTGY